MKKILFILSSFTVLIVLSSAITYYANRAFYVDDSGNLDAYGTIKSKCSVSADATEDNVLTASQMRNIIHINYRTDTIYYDLPACESGLCATFYDLGGAAIRINAKTTADIIYLNGIALANNDTIYSLGTITDQMRIVGINDSVWLCMERVGTWTSSPH